jgi:hypothetical protein
MGAEKGCVYVLPVVAVASEVQLAGQAYSKIAAVVTVGLVVAFKMRLVNISTNRSRERTHQGQPYMDERSRLAQLGRRIR